MGDENEEFLTGSIFLSAKVTLAPSICKKLGFDKIAKVCMDLDTELLIREEEGFHVQGCLKSLVNLEAKLAKFLKEEQILSNLMCKTRNISRIEAENLGVLRTQRNLVNRDDKLPFLNCDFCSFKTKRPNHLKKHLLKHDNETIVECDKCDFKCLRVSELTKHQIKYHNAVIKKPKGKKDTVVPDQVNLLECTKCDYKTINSAFMTRHIYRKHEKKTRLKPPANTLSKIHRCQICSYTTMKISNLLRHQLIHTNERKHLCITCGLSFKRSDTLKQHLAVHGLDSSKFCDICGRICRSQNHLNDHKATHSDLRNFLCHICGMAFKTKATQGRHLRTVHDNHALQKCMHCGQKVASIQSLTRHLRTFHADKETFDINDQEEEVDNDEEPVIYTLDLDQEGQNASLENNLQYLINESGSLIISTDLN